MIHKVTGYHTLNKKKTMQSMSHEEFEATTRAKWNGWGLSISNIYNTLIEFAVRVIYQKFYQYRKLSSVPCMIVDRAWKIVMKDHEYDLFKL